MFRLNFDLKPVFGVKPRFQTLLLTKDKVTQYSHSNRCTYQLRVSATVVIGDGCSYLLITPHERTGEWRLITTAHAHSDATAHAHSDVTSLISGDLTWH